MKGELTDLQIRDLAGLTRRLYIRGSETDPASDPKEWLIPLCDRIRDLEAHIVVVALNNRNNLTKLRNICSDKADEIEEKLADLGSDGSALCGEEVKLYQAEQRLLVWFVACLDDLIKEA